MAFSSPWSAVSMRLEKRLRIACSFSLRPAVRHRMYVSSPCGIATFFTSTSGRTRVQSSFSSSSSNRFIWLRGVPVRYWPPAHDAAIEHPDPSRLAILALYHAQARLHGRDIAAVAVERFVTERKAFIFYDQCDHQLLAVGPMI